MTSDPSGVEALAEEGMIEYGLETYGPGKFKLLGEDGNAFSIIGRVKGALQKEGWTPRLISVVTRKMTESTYERLLVVAMSVQDGSMD